MHISRFQIHNYKSFLESTALSFTPGFNVISGQNNAGKTAFLEALGLRFEVRPHRRLKTVAARDTVPEQRSWADVSFTLSAGELREFMLSAPQPYLVFKPSLTSAFAQKIRFIDDSADSVRRLLDAIFSERELTFKLRAQATPGGGFGWPPVEIPSYGLYPPQGPVNAWNAAQFTMRAGGEFEIAGALIQSPSDFGQQLAGVFQKHVYRFSAERLKVGKSAHGVSALLNQDASNLPEVLNQLQHNPSRFRDLNEHLSAILPQIKHVSVRAIGAGQVEVVVWPHDPESRREDLALPLGESGTGIGQVLAILYVVLTSERPQVIIIDEPQSFLHPGAARKLIEFLKLYPQHQYIIATHSATIISAAGPTTILVARYEDCDTTLEQLDAEAERSVQAVLNELGVRLSD